MQLNPPARNIYRDTSRLSILYLRCIYLVALAKKHRGAAEALSILYLRCKNSGVSAVHVKTRKTFNSLFEMREMPKFVRYQPLDNNLSILYLRCSPNTTLATSANGVPFQFSI